MHLGTQSHIKKHLIMPDLFTNSSSAFFTHPQNLVLDSVVTAA